MKTIGLLAFLALAKLSNAAELSTLNNNPPCSYVDEYLASSLEIERLAGQAARLSCRLEQPENAEKMATRMLGEERFALSVDGDELTVAVRPLNGPAQLIGALYTPVEAIEGTDMFLSRFRLERLSEGRLEFYRPPFLQSDEELEKKMVGAALTKWVGPDAPDALEGSDKPIAGQQFGERLYSKALKETRLLEIYLPPDHDPKQSYPAVFFADGGKVTNYAKVFDELIVNGEIEPIILVGAISGEAGVVEDRSEITKGHGINLRNADYIPGRLNNPPRFEQHLTFFADELVAYSVKAFGVSKKSEERAVTGRSSGGAFAFQAGHRRPDVFGHALPMSPSPSELSNVIPQDKKAKFYFAAGRYEAPFIRSAWQYNSQLASQGYEVQLKELSAGHTHFIDRAGMVPFVISIFKTEDKRDSYAIGSE